MVSKKKLKDFFFLTFLYLGKTDMVLGKKVAILDWEWGRNLPLEMGRKSPGHMAFTIGVEHPLSSFA